MTVTTTADLGHDSTGANRKPSDGCLGSWFIRLPEDVLQALPAAPTLA